VLLNQDFCVQVDRILFEEARKHTDLIEIFSTVAYGRGHRKSQRCLSTVNHRIHSQAAISSG